MTNYAETVRTGPPEEGSEHDRQREAVYRKRLNDLEDRESFNFALFQYSPNATVVVDREGRVIKTNIARRSRGDRIPEIGDVMYRDYAARHTTDLYAALMRCINQQSVETFPCLKYREKSLAVTIAGFPAGAIISTQDITSRVQAEEDRDRLIQELRRALDEVEQLRGLLPICACCKKIRDDSGYWQEIETYITSHSKVHFSHAMCPPCTKKMYPEIYDRIFNQEGALKDKNERDAS